jgi:nucleoside-diphosphate-sugar epimerase
MGYTGRELARQAAARGWRVCGTTTAASGEGSPVLNADATKGDDDRHNIEVVTFAPRRDGSDRARRSGGTTASAAAEALLSPSGRAALASATHVLSSIPPVATPLYDPVLSAQLELLQWRVAMARDEDDDGSPAPPPPPLRWIGYLSSTGVYGDWGGEWVDEDSDPAPVSARGVVRLEHERAWERALAKMMMAEEQAGARARPPPPAFRVFRLGGIYGPGRSVLEPLLSEGGRRRGSEEADAAPSSSPQRARRRRQRFTSRVHVADAARAALASAARAAAAEDDEGDGFPPLPARVYNVVDDLPAPRSEVEAYALGRLREAGMEVGVHVVVGKGKDAAAASGGGGGKNEGERGASSSSSLPPPLEEKRVRNTRFKGELLCGGELLYPTYRPAIDELVESHVSSSL